MQRALLTSYSVLQGPAHTFAALLQLASECMRVQGANLDQLPSLRKMQRKAGFLDELGAQKLNSQQREAVASVLVGAGGGRHPLTLFGPPGTGKTVTLVECALQVCLELPHTNNFNLLVWRLPAN